MSDRTTTSPEFALRDLAVDINRRLTRAARRIKWHSGVPDVYELGDIDVPRTDFSFGTNFTNTLLEFEVDPGRWTILATSHWVPTPTSATLFNGRSGIGIVVGSDIIGRSDRISTVSQDAIESPHFASGAFIATETTTVLLRAYALYFEPFDTSVFRETRMSAIGG